jgi:formylglycine-generating enzyme required for sulfatase activity
MRFLLALLLTATSVLAADPVVLTLEQSTDNLSTWQEVAVTTGMVANGKLVDSATSGTSKFYRMRIVQAAPTPTPIPTPAPTPVLTPNLVMVTVQGGTMPAPSELAGQIVATFAIGNHEVTWDEWQTVRTWAVTHGYSDLEGVGGGSAGNHPVREVNWYDCVKWCNAKSEMEGLVPVYQVVDQSGYLTYKTDQSDPTIVAAANGYRLPTDLEWEWAARGGLSTRGYIYSGNDDLNAVGWYWDNSAGAAALNYFGGHGTWPVGQKQANELGINDMSGNMYEWCFDRVSFYGQDRRIRGGSWDSTADRCTVAFRDGGYPVWHYPFIGFRTARSLGN